MRRLLGAMRSDGEDAERSPQPGLDRLDSLIEEIGRAGLPVRLQVEGERIALPRRDRPLGLSNRPGGPDQRAQARARQPGGRRRPLRRPATLQIEVRDDGGGAQSGDGLGHGLIGVRERVKIYGGEMSAGTASGGGFVLSTRLPLARDAL